MPDDARPRGDGDEARPAPAGRASRASGAAHAAGATGLRRTLTTLPLVFVMYFNISGGAFSTEGLVAEVGPSLALLALLVVPLVWSLPETLLVAELASMLPEEGGYYRWVRRAFGPFWAFQNGWWTWLYSLVDMALYPVLFNQYLAWFLPSLGAGARWCVSLLVIWGATAINLRGSLRVGWASVLAGAVVLGGFGALTLLALPHVAHAPWSTGAAAAATTHAPDAASLGVGLSIALWNYIGWDNASTVQGEVVDATRTYPRALAWTLPLVVLGYFAPLLATLGATDWTTWREGGWPEIARAAIGGGTGRVVGAWLALAGMASALALFNALLLAYSRIPLAMAVDGLLPPALARTDARGTPRAAVLFSALCYSAFALLPFGTLVVADVLLYALALALEFGALVALRRREPALRGAFRVPVGTAGIVVLALLPAAVLGGVVALNLMGGEYGAGAVVAALSAAALGVPLYALAERARVRRATAAAAA